MILVLIRNATTIYFFKDVEDVERDDSMLILLIKYYP